MRVSNYLGVDWDRAQAKWRAYMELNGDIVTLGFFDSEEDAALRRDRAVRQHIGWDAPMNFQKKRATLGSLRPC